MLGNCFFISVYLLLFKTSANDALLFMQQTSYLSFMLTINIVFFVYDSNIIIIKAFCVLLHPTINIFTENEYVGYYSEVLPQM